MMDPTGNISATKAALSSGDPLGSRTLASRAPSRPANQHSCRKSTGPRISEGSQGWLIKPVGVLDMPKPSHGNRGSRQRVPLSAYMAMTP